MIAADHSLFFEIIERVRSKSDVIICLSTGGGKDMTVEERVSAVPKFKPELASLNMGSMNFGMFPLAKKHDTWKHDWEKPFLESTRDFIFRNTFSDIEKILKQEKRYRPSVNRMDSLKIISYHIKHLLRVNGE